MLLRVYDVATGALVDTLASGRLAAETELTGEDYAGSISEFFYRKGWSYAEYLAPAWMPAERRIYLGDKLLDSGYYFFEQEQFERAGEIWERALERKPSVATRAAVNIAWLLERNGEFEAAARLLKETLERVEGTRVAAPLRRYARQQVSVLEQRVEDDRKLKEQL
jgi:tetratricopeptide (TPR) repeat protein